MKNSVIIQTLLLVTSIILGMVIASGINAELGEVHGMVGRIACVVTIITTTIAFRKKYSRSIKMLSVVSLAFVISAALGGGMLDRSSNYNLSFMQMTISGYAACLVSIILFFKIKSISHSAKASK